MKKLITNYIFDASARTVELPEYGSDFDIKRLLLIVNKTDNIVIYNFAVSGLGYTGVTGDVVTLTYNTTSMSDSTDGSDGDQLLIYYDDPNETSIITGPAAENAAVSGNPILVGGRYDSSDRTLGNGDAGAIALDADGAVKISDGGDAITVDGTVAVSGTSAVSIADGSSVTLGAKADAKNSATDTTAITAMQVLKQISHELQETVSGSLADNTSNPDTTVHGSMIMGLEADGNWDRLKSTSGELQVTIPNLEHAEDSSHTSTDKGIMPLAVRNDTLAALAGTDGDYAPLQVNSTGALFVTIDDGGGAITVDGTVAVTHAALTELGTAINASDQVDVNIASGGFDGAVTNAGLTAIDAAIGTTGATGPTKAMSIAATLSGGNLQELLADSDGHLQIDVLSAPSTAVTNTGLTALDNAIHAEDAAHSSGNTGIMPLAVRNDTLAALGGADGDYAPLQVNAAGALYVDFSTSAVDGAYLNTNLNIAGADLAAGAGNMSAQTARVTIASDDTHYGAVGAAADVDGVIHGQLRYIGDAVGAIQTAVEVLDDWDDSNYANVNMNLAGSDAQAGEGAITSSTQRVTIATDDDSTAHLATIAGAVDTELQVDIVGALPTGSNTIGKLDANSGVDIGDVDVTSTVVPAGQATLTSYNQFTVETSVAALTHANHLNTTETAAKEIFIQADYDNSGFVMVGSSGTAATGTLKGIRLDAGDTLILAVADIADVFMDASAGSQKALVTITK